MSSLFAATPAEPPSGPPGRWPAPAHTGQPTAPFADSVAALPLPVALLGPAGTVLAVGAGWPGGRTAGDVADLADLLGSAADAAAVVRAVTAPGAPGGPGGPDGPGNPGGDAGTDGDGDRSGPVTVPGSAGHLLHLLPLAGAATPLTLLVLESAAAAPGADPADEPVTAELPARGAGTAPAGGDADPTGATPGSAAGRRAVAGVGLVDAVALTLRLRLLGDALAGADDTAAVAEVVCRESALAVGAGAAALWRLGPEGHPLLACWPVAAGAAGPGDVDRGGAADELGPLRVLAAYGAEVGHAVWCGGDQAGAVPAAVLAALRQRAGESSWAALPVGRVDADTLMLVLGLPDGGLLPTAERTFLTAAAAQAAQALTRAELLGQLRAEAAVSARATARLAVLARLRASLRLDAPADQALQAAADAVTVDFAAAALALRVVTEPAEARDSDVLLDGAGRQPLRLRPVALGSAAPLPGWPGGLDRLGPARLVAGAAAVAVASGTVQVRSWPPGTPAGVIAAGLGARPDGRAARWLAAAGVHAALVLPLGDAADPLGLLVLVRAADSAPFSPDDAALGAELADRTTGALRAAQRFRRQRAVALTLQRSLLAVPHVSSQEVRLASRYVPGGADTEVGGDWVDAVDLGAGRVALVVGDVMGRGVRAAAVMGQLRAAVRAYAMQDLPPAELLHLLDRLVADLPDNEFATCLYAVYDPGLAELAVAVAGHVPPLVLHPDGQVTEVLTDAGTPLGVGRGIFSTRTLSLPPGAIIVLYTDGLVESRGSDLDAGLLALREALRAAAGPPGPPPGQDLDALAGGLLAAMGRDQGHDDDVAVLVVQIPPERVSPAVRVTLPLGVQAAAAGRSVLHDFLTGGRGGPAGPEVAHAAALVVSELVTNAVRYGRHPIELRLRRAPTRLVCEVADAGPHLPQRRQAAPDDEGGRGLELVSALSARWGVRQSDPGKVVWSEIPLGE